MSTRVSTAVCAVVLGTAVPNMAQSAPTTRVPVAVPDEIIVKFKSGIDSHACDALLAAIGAIHTTSLGRTGAQLVGLATPTAAEVIVQHAEDPSVVYIEPNFLYEAAAVPNEPWFSQQWALLNTGQTGGTPGADIRATAAWDLGTGLSSVVIGILDSGIDFAHPDLAGNLYVNPGEIPDNGLDDDGNGFADDVHGWDFVSDDNDPQDDNGHGTFGAGIIGAVANNGIGITGVCWRVSLLPIKFLDETGIGTTANAIRALDYAISMAVPITSNSWGGGGFSQALLDAIRAADQVGVTFVVSAGASSTNLDLTPTYPASYDVPNVVAVAATDHDDHLATFSNYGPETVDLAAPGVGILTTSLGSSYSSVSGTSTATAHVSGALGLVLARFPGMAGTSAATHLLAHVEKIPSLVGLVQKGGRLDAYSPLAETPTDVSGDNRVVPAGATGTRLWWRFSNPEGVRLGLYLPRAEPAELVIFDVRGRRIRALFDGARAPGFHEIDWDGRSDRGARAASGVYIARLRSGTGCATTRIFVGR